MTDHSVWPYVMMMIGEVSIAGSIVVTAVLRFARWNIEREDRLEYQRQDRDGALTDEVWTLKRTTLLKQRAELEKRVVDLTRGGYLSQATENQEAIAVVDRELTGLGSRVVKALADGTA